MALAPERRDHQLLDLRNVNHVEPRLTERRQNMAFEEVDIAPVA